MRLEAAQARARFTSSSVARLATVGADGRPHLVPIAFAVSAGDVLYSAVDGKPKSTTALRRLVNIAANPQVAILVDHYEDDWSRLWWVRADGIASILAEPGPETETALRLLAERYPVYRAERPPGPVIAVAVRRWSGWSSAG